MGTIRPLTSSSSSRRRRRVIYPWTLNRLQTQIYEARERFLVLVAGRRFGKTILAICWLLTEILSRPRGSKGYYVLPFRNQAKDIAWDALKFATREFRTDKDETELSITLPGDRKLVLKGADDPESLEGVKLAAAVLDEFARMKLAAYQKSLRPALSDSDGRVLFIGKPRGRNHLKQFFDRGHGATKIPNWRAWQFTTRDGGYVSEEDLAEAKRDLPPKIFRQEYMASFETLAGRIYDEFVNGYAPNGHVIPAAQVPPSNAFARGAIGIDWGFTHPGVAVAIGESAGRKVVTAEEFHAEFKIEQWEASLAKMRDRCTGFSWFADPSRPDLITHFSDRLGITIQPAYNDVDAGILEVMTLVHPREDLGNQPRLVVSDACPNVITGLDNYVWDTDREGNPREKPLKVKDDAADATRYAAMGLREGAAVGPLDYDPMDNA